MEEMRSSSSSSSSQAFTKSQWEELELQALIFNYMALGIPIPAHLILPFQRSFSLHPFPLHPSMICERKGVGEEDPEPWRCKRTDGKKWRCSREAFGDSKYCERHKHRGKKGLMSGTKTTEMLPLFTTLSPSARPPPLPFNSHPRNVSEPSSFFAGGGAARLHFEEEEEKEKEMQEHCFVFGADLKLQKPVNVGSERRDVASPRLRLSFFSDFPDAREDNRATQLSISIPRC